MAQSNPQSQLHFFDINFVLGGNQSILCPLRRKPVFLLLQINIKVVPKKIIDDQIHFKAGSLKNIIMEIPLWQNVPENV